MKTYELTYIISSQITQEKADSIKKEFESFIQSKEGSVLSSEKISIQTLAYPMKKSRSQGPDKVEDSRQSRNVRGPSISSGQSSGYFVGLTFQVSEEKIKEIKEKLEKNNEILRHLILVKKPQKELKKTRIRKPLTTLRSKVTEELFFIKTHEDKKKAEPVKLDEIEKKLDEILSE